MNKTQKKSTTSVVLLAGGKSSRIHGELKQWVVIKDKPVFAYALNVFLTHPQVNQVVLVVREQEEGRIKKWLKDNEITGIIVAIGGTTRQESATNGFKKLKNLQSNDIVIFHNAANPFVTEAEITAVINSAQKEGAACVGHPATSTLKKIENGKIKKTLDREAIGQAETPQAVQAGLYEKALKKGLKGTDEMSLVEALGVVPKWLPASEYNFKITTRRDLETVRLWLEGRCVRTGIGMDSHRFSSSEKGLALGGVLIKSEPKMIANSDGDVILHALCNAILQALGEGYSLGKIADPMCLKKGIKNSRHYLKEILKIMRKKNFEIQNVGIQLEGRRPKIDPISLPIKKSLARLLSIHKERIGITATSGEDLTPFGKGEGLQCFAVVHLESKKSGILSA